MRAVLPQSSFSYIGLVSAIPPLCTIMVMPFWSMSSDRRIERTWHIVLPLIMAAVGWLMIINLTEPLLRLIRVDLLFDRRFLCARYFLGRCLPQLFRGKHAPSASPW